jgi:hypothetical protein
VGEVDLAVRGPSKDGLYFGPINQGRYEPLLRRVVQTSLGPIVTDVAKPHPDMDDPLSIKAGVEKRFGSAPPSPEAEFLEGYRAFVKTWLEENMTPLSTDSDCSFETWLSSTNYTEARKTQLRQVQEKLSKRVIGSEKRDFHCKSFIKDETYTDYKYPRAINARSDDFKVLSGPIFKLIEKALFSRDEFIKKIPVNDRPKYIMNKLYREAAKYVATDYTSFEALFTAQILEAGEMQLYAYMTKDMPGGQAWYDIIHEVLTGENVCVFKNITVKLPATRMSGEMCTSLGNSFANLMFLLYVCKSVGATDVAAVIEGDDGLAVMNGPTPTPEDFARLGLTIKLDVHENLEDASLCGMIFDRNDLINITDPLKMMAGFGWTEGKYSRAGRNLKNQLLKSKALSLAYQYPGCPILQTLAFETIKRLGHVSNEYAIKRAMKSASEYEREWLAQILRCLNRIVPKIIPLSTRQLMERVFGITIDQQLRTEAYLENHDMLTPLDITWLNWPSSWHHYSRNYVMDVCTHELNYPSRLWAIDFPETVPTLLSTKEDRNQSPRP